MQNLGSIDLRRTAGLCPKSVEIPERVNCVRWVLKHRPVPLS